MRRFPIAAVAAALAVGLVGCTPALFSSVESVPLGVSGDGIALAPVASEGEVATFDSVIDGDTIKTSAGTVRIIGIDTPERGECGHDAAAAAIGRLISPGAPVTLVFPPGQDDRDRHGRLLRLVVTESGVDLGQMQIDAGNAVARYDSRDGYPGHPNEESYHSAQTAMMGPDRTVIITSCQAAAVAPESAPEPPAEAVTPEQDRWWQQYTSCGRLKKNEVGHPTGPFNRDDPAQVEAYKWFAFGTGNNGDGEGDGLACE